MCFQLHKSDFHIEEEAPSNSLAKRAALFCQIGRQIQYLDIFVFPQQSAFTAMQSLPFHHSILPFNVFEINSRM